MSQLTRRAGIAAAALCLGVAGLLASSATANASLFTVTVTSATLNGGQLRVEGSGAEPGSNIAAFSTTDVADVRVGTDGKFKIEASNFTAPDCFITVQDPDAPVVTVPLQGCTRSVKPVQPPTPPTGSCVISPDPLVTLPVGSTDPVTVDGTTVTLQAGDLATVNFLTTGCGQISWSIAAGVIPTGMTGPDPQGADAAHISGTPSIPGTYEFTLQADSQGSTDQENFTVIVD